MSPLAGIAGRIGRIARQVGGLRIVVTLAMLFVAIAVARYSWSLPFTVSAESTLFDIRAAVSAPRAPPDSRIVLVVYNDDTLIQTGKRSPVDRTVLANALRRLDAMGAKSIGIDILIDQPQPEDPALVAAFRSMKTPTFLAYASKETNADKITYEQQTFLDRFLASLAPGNVHPTSIRLEPGGDGIARRWPPRVRGLPPAMPNAVANPPPLFDRYAGSIFYRIPDEDDRELFTAIPIQTLADDTLFAMPDVAQSFAAQIRGRHVLIGGNIVDTDLFLTPLGQIALDRTWGKPAWGLQIFAHMLAQQLDGRAYAPIPDWVIWLAAILIVAAAALTALADLRPWMTALVLAAQLAAMGYLPFWLHQNMIDTYGLPVFGWVAGWTLAFLAVGSAARAVGSEQRRFAQSALGKYLPRDIAAQILRDPEGLSLHGEKRELFIVFTDLEGFTKLSHAIPPETVASLLNRYLEMLSDVVLRHGGTIDKFVGDAVVAFWGAPIARSDDGERAVRAAIAMHAAGEQFRREAGEDVPRIGRTRVGLHYGDAVVGNFGGEGRIQYTALGDAMNTASRLESANKQLGTSVLVSRDALERSNATGFRFMGTIEVRGRATPVDIFEPCEADADELTTFTQTVEAAQKGDGEALATLRSQAAMHPDDAGLRNLVYRLEHRTDGGYFVLD